MNRSHVLPGGLGTGERAHIRYKAQIAFGLAILKSPLILITIFAIITFSVGIKKLNDYTIERVREAETVRLETFALALSEHVKESIKRGDDLLKQIRLAYLSDPASVRPLLVAHNKVADRDAFPLEAVIGADGLMLISTADGGISTQRLDLSDREHFRFHKEATDPSQDAIFFSKIVLGRVSKLPVMQITRAFRSPKGELLAVGVVSMNPVGLVEPYRKMTATGTSITLVGDDRIGRMRVAGDTVDYTLDFRKSPMMNEIMNNRNGSIQGVSSVDGIARIYSYHDVPDLPLKVVVGSSLSKASHGIFSAAAGEIGLPPYLGVLIIAILAVLLYLTAWSRVLELRLLDSNSALSRTIRDMSMAQAAQRQFVASVSHELRTPLHGILGHAQMISLDAPTGPMRESAEAIFKSATDLRATVGELLDLARVEAGRELLHFKSENVATLVREICTLHRQSAEHAGLQFVTELKEIEAVSIRTDALALKRCLHNLISNAVKFTPHGRIVVRGVPRDDGGISLSVTDTGVGIAPQNVEKIFDYYSYLSRTAKSNVAGTGLGLALCRKLLHLLSGTLSVESTPGKGSTFTVTLPKWATDNASAAIDAEATISNENIDR